MLGEGEPVIIVLPPGDEDSACPCFHGEKSSVCRPQQDGGPGWTAWQAAGGAAGESQWLGRCLTCPAIHEPRSSN